MNFSPDGTRQIMSTAYGDRMARSPQGALSLSLGVDVGGGFLSFYNA